MRHTFQNIDQGHLRLVNSKFFAVLAALAASFALATSANAGFVVGGGTGNDSESEVVAIINDYNASHEPDLPTHIELFKKTDNDAPFVFDMSNGFKFYSDAGGTMPVTTEMQLQNLTTAYFEYTGPESLFYYSLKAGSGVTVYTFMSGLNEIGGGQQAISHVSFWTAPEPAGWMLALIGASAAFAARRRIGAQG